MRCASGPLRTSADHREFHNYELGNHCELPGRELDGGCGRCHHRGGHLAHDAPQPDLLAGGADLRRSLPGWFFIASGCIPMRCLQIFFLAFTLYGWWYWWRGVREEGEVRVVRLPLQAVAGLAAGAAGSVLLGLLMERIGAALPRLDATLMSYSLVASWWQTRKHIANWWLWIAVDLVYVGEYLYKGLRPTAALYVGWWRWPRWDCGIGGALRKFQKREKWGATRNIRPVNYVARPWRKLRRDRQSFEGSHGVSCFPRSMTRRYIAGARLP
jgi:hypothetical protein